MIFYGVAVAFFTFTSGHCWESLAEHGAGIRLFNISKRMQTVDAEYRMMIPTHGSTGHQTYFAVGSCEGKRQI